MSLLMPNILDLARKSLTSEIRQNLKNAYVCKNTLVYEFSSIYCKMLFDSQKQSIKHFWEQTPYPHFFKEFECKILIPKGKEKQ